jgi:hypothetical protein
MSRLEDPIEGAARSEIGGVVVDEVVAGEGRVKRRLGLPSEHRHDG